VCPRSRQHADLGGKLPSLAPIRFSALGNTSTHSPTATIRSERGGGTSTVAEGEINLATRSAVWPMAGIAGTGSRRRPTSAIVTTISIRQKNWSHGLRASNASLRIPGHVRQDEQPQSGQVHGERTPADGLSLWAAGRGTTYPRRQLSRGCNLNKQDLRPISRNESCPVSYTVK
jgi:hypothetical protein